jgi:D-3-phosphoglycerate dehydrogenase
MDNVMLAPHNSNSSPAAWERVHWNTIRNLLDGLSIPHEDFEQIMQQYRAAV